MDQSSLQNNNNKCKVISRFENNGEVPREQVLSHINGRTREQRSAAVVIADTADSNHDPDLEPDAEPADPNAAARTAGPEAVRDAQDAPSAAHETVEQSVGTLMETLMQMRIPRPTTWKLQTVLKLSRTPKFKAPVQNQSVVCQDQTGTHQDPVSKVIGVIKVNNPNRTQK